MYNFLHIKKERIICRSFGLFFILITSRAASFAAVLPFSAFIRIRTPDAFLTALFCTVNIKCSKKYNQCNDCNNYKIIHIQPQVIFCFFFAAFAASSAFALLLPLMQSIAIITTKATTATSPAIKPLPALPVEITVPT